MRHKVRQLGVSVTCLGVMVLLLCCGGEGSAGGSDGDPENDAGMAGDAGSAGQFVVEGDYDHSYSFFMRSEGCLQDKWTADITLRCTGCSPGTPGHGARVLAWQLAEDRWLDLGLLELTPNQGVESMVDLGVHGLGCGDVGTALLLVAVGPGKRGRHAVYALRRGATNGVVVMSRNIDFNCRVDEAVRAEAIVYNYNLMTVTQRVELNPPLPEDDLQSGNWTGRTERLEESEFMALVGYTEEGAIHCAIFL